MGRGAFPPSVGSDRKSARTIQGAKHFLCVFQSWVKSRRPSVRATIVEQQQRARKEA